MTYARFERLNFRRRDGTIHPRLRVAFVWKGPNDARPRRYRESTGLDDNRENRRLWRSKLEEMTRELIATNRGVAGPFDPSRWLPRAPSLEPPEPAAPPRTIGDFARQYLGELPAMGIGEETREHYRLIIGKHVLPSALARLPLRNVNDGHIKTWVAGLLKKTNPQGRPLQAVTVNKIIARMRTMVTIAWKRGEIDGRVNPMELVDNLPMDGREPNPFSPEELLALFSACEGQQRALYTTLVFTGMRPSEALGLYPEHVDFKAGILRVRQQIRENGSVDQKLKTKRSRRDIVMFEPVRAALAALAVRNRLRSKFVFANREGGALTVMTQGDHPWRRAVARAGVEYRPLYTLRHTYTSLMLSAQKPLQWVAHQLGHVGVAKIDEVYGRWLRTPSAETLDLEKLFESIAKLPPYARDVRPIQPKSGPSQRGENGEERKSA
ncbi:MAG TPA: tyrosine-type recombinase/integrase [Candidatus Binataceae bacterium]|nr:tyrosine-type recombinase/integrase [Candidatus Binataceae bacterium]